MSISHPILTKQFFIYKENLLCYYNLILVFLSKSGSSNGNIITFSALNNLLISSFYSNIFIAQDLIID